MTVVYDMAGGSIRSHEPQQDRDDDRHEIEPDRPADNTAPELQVIETSSTPRDDSIHLIRGLMNKS
jgi:hypothetical protein